MDENVREIDRPFHVFGVLDGTETFHSGHFTKDTADMHMNESNKKAEGLGIKTRYIMKEKK